MAASKPKNAQKRTAKQAEVSAERVRDLIDASWRESKASKPVEMQPENMVIIPGTDILDAERRAKSCAIEALEKPKKRMGRPPKDDKLVRLKPVYIPASEAEAMNRALDENEVSSESEWVRARLAKATAYDNSLK